MNPVKTISYSKYSLFNQCPKKFKYIYIEKFKEPPSEILERGSAMHKAMEEHLTIPNFPAPVFAEWLAPYLKPIKKYLISEEFWQADENFKPLAPFHPAIKYVGKVDAYFVKGSMLVLIDWKTGKVREKNMEQLELYAVLALNKFPEVEEVTLDLIYLDHEQIISESFTREELPRLEQMWKARIQRFEEAIEFPPNVTALCGWCAFSKRVNNGPCEAHA